MSSYDTITHLQGPVMRFCMEYVFNDSVFVYSHSNYKKLSLFNFGVMRHESNLGTIVGDRPPMQTNVNAYAMGFTDTLVECAMFVRVVWLSCSC